MIVFNRPECKKILQYFALSKRSGQQKLEQYFTILFINVIYFTR